MVDFVRMHRIDFLGVPGVGKTTLYRHLLARRGRSTWITPTDGIRRFAVAALLGGRAWLLPALGIPGLREVAYGYARIRCKRTGKNIYLRERHRWEPVLSEVFGNATFEQPAVWLQRASSFHGKLQEVLLVQEYVGRRWVIWDESLTHRLVCVCATASDPQRRAARAFEVIPAPDAVIYCYSAIRTIGERITGRRKGSEVDRMEEFRGGDTGYAHEWTRCAANVSEVAASVMKKRGIEVLMVDTSRNIEEQVIQVEGFLKPLLGRNEPSFSGPEA